MSARTLIAAVNRARRKGRPILLDLCCKAGGAAVGYHRAGFEVVGCDIERQKRFPFPFIQADALEVLANWGLLFDAIHGSPPCQRWSQATKMRGLEGIERHPDLIAPMRALLFKNGRPWVMENVPGSPLLNPVKLCGTMFGLRVYRHRLFESSELLFSPPHPRHVKRCVPIFAHELREGGGFAAMFAEGRFVTVASGTAHVSAMREAMGIDWMTKDEMCQAIPPAYTRFLGEQLMLSALARRVA